MLFLKKIDGFVGPCLARLLPQPARVTSITPTPSRFLLIRPGGIGDAVLLAPVILLLKKTYPACRVEVLAEKRNHKVFALCSGVDQIFCYDNARDLTFVMRQPYDVVIDTEQWHRLSAIVARLTRSKVKIGFGTNERKRLLTHVVNYSQDAYELNSFFDLMRPLGLRPPAAHIFPYLAVSDADQKLADEHLGALGRQPFIVLFPGASIPERCWGAEKFHALAIRLNQNGFPVVVVGGREECAAAEAILASGSGLNLAGKTSLAVTVGVLNRSQLLVSGDSGVLHLGVGLGLPTVSLFGPGIEQKWAPSGEQHIVLNHKLPCSPCTKFGTTPPCPIGAKCMRDISVDEVFVAAQSLLPAKPQLGT
jgi:lipopolysaccharide heptosyltransferase II